MSAPIEWEVKRQSETHYLATSDIKELCSSARNIIGSEPEQYLRHDVSAVYRIKMSVREQTVIESCYC